MKSQLELIFNLRYFRANDKVTGDCGSWVIDSTSNVLYGQVVAGHSGDKVVYIIPAHRIFEDIEQQVGHLNLYRKLPDADNLIDSIDTIPDAYGIAGSHETGTANVQENLNVDQSRVPPPPYTKKEEKNKKLWP